MKKYTGTKTLLAVAMTLGAYNELRGWDIPADEDPTRQGYLVEYPLVGDDKPNLEGHDGYVSWSPKAPFEKHYRESETFEERLLSEVQDEAAKLNKLNQFMGSDKFPLLPREDKDLLYSQQRIMSEFVQILGKRLERAGESFKHSD